MTNGFPSHRYGPNGQSKIFHAEADIPKGWEDHPNKVGQVFSTNPRVSAAIESGVADPEVGVFATRSAEADALRAEVMGDVPRQPGGFDVTCAEIVAERDAAGLRDDGPTRAEFVAAGYSPVGYPPEGYAAKAPDPKADRAHIINALHTRQMHFSKNTPTMQLYDMLVAAVVKAKSEA